MHQASGVRAALRGKRVAFAVAAAFVPLGEAYALPTGESVVHGDVQVTRPTAQMMQINQGTQKGIVNWTGFSIGGSEHVNITQPNSAASLLNRVIGNNPSEIFGRLTANGQLFLVNNAGVFFAPGASVEVGSLVASTLSITDQNFLNGTYQFFNPGNAGSVVNQGSIVTAGGYTALIGPQVRNDGVILANSGKIALGAGNRVSLDMIGDGLVSISVDEAAFNASVINTGTLQADGGTVLLKASSANALLDTVINTSGIVRANSLMAVNGEIILGAGGAVAVNGVVESGGTVSISATGALTVASSASSDARVSSNTGQTITAQSIEVTAQNGTFAQVVNNVSGDQVITVTGGAAGSGLTVQNLGGAGAFITNFAPTQQRIEATNADHIKVDGRAGSANISNPLGEQTVSITGSGLNAITLGSDGATGRSIINGSSQTITAGNPGESGSITLTGGAVNLAPASFVNAGPTLANTQTIHTSGTLSINGGTAIGQTQSAGIFQNRPGQQTVSAANIVMQGGPSGSGNGAFINSTFGGDQTLTVTGEVRLTGGDGGSANRAGIVTNANQTINGNPDLVLAGGAGGAGTNVFIQATGSGSTTQQTINARGIELRSGAGADASATLNAAKQVITTTGDVSLFGGAGLGGLNGVRIGGIGGSTLGPTDLTLNVGGNLLLHGGAANGASLGSSGASTAANTIRVTAQGNVTLESEGAGARIGSSSQVGATPGEISVTAGSLSGNGDEIAGSLQLGSGTAIRTNGPITLTVNSLTNAGTITNGGGTNSANMILNANAFDLADGNIQGGAAAVVLRPRDGTRSFGIEAAGQTTLTNADIASINTSNFVVFGSGIGTNFTGNMTMGENAQVNGGTKGLAFFRSPTAGGTTTIGAQGVTTTRDVIVSAGGGAILSNGGTVAGDEVQLRAGQGIGAPGARVNTAANALGISNLGGAGIFVSEADAVTLRPISLNVGGMINNAGSNTAGTFDFTAGGDLTVNGFVSSNGLMNINVAGALNVVGNGGLDGVLLSGGGQTITAQSVNVSAQDGRLGQIVNNGIGAQTITTGALTLSGGSALVYPNLSGVVQNAGDAQTINASSILVQGTNAGANNGIFIRAALGDQQLNVTGDITIAAGAGGEAWIQGSANGQQTIHARNITMTNAQGGTNSFAALQAAHQEIHASGDVRLTAGATAGANGGVRLGGLRNPLVQTGTDLELHVDGDLVLTGGTAPDNGASIGTSGSFALPNNIYIEARSVTLNAGSASGAGARIGSGSNALAGGSIEIHAQQGISLDGSTGQSAAIRTLGSVMLDAASISETGNGFILADTLTTTTSGVTNLAGSNQIAKFSATSGGALTLVDSGALQVTGITTTNDPITLTTGSLTNTGTISNTGGAPGVANMIFSADAFNLAGGTIDAGAAAVILRPRTGTNSFGIEAAGQTTLTNADIASIHTSDFVVFGSSMGTTFTGNMTIGENAQVDGGGKHLAFFRSTNLGGTTTIGAQGVATTGDVIVAAGGGAIVSNGGTVRGDEVQLKAGQSIGTAAARIQTAANALAINSGNAFVSELDNLTLRNITLNVGGITNFGNNVLGGALGLAAGGAVNVAGVVQSVGQNIDVAGALSLDASLQNAVLSSFGGQTITAQSINQTAQNGLRANIENFSNGNQTITATAGDMNLQVPGSFGVAQIINNAPGGNQTVTANGQLSVLGGVISPATSRNSGIFKNGGPGLQTIKASGITLQGANTGTQAGALISSQGDQLIDVTGGNINIFGGNGGNINNVAILASASGQQTIWAHDINLANGFGGIDTVAAIQAGHQDINATGNVTLTSQGALLGAAAGGPGVRIGAPQNTPAGTDIRLRVGGNLTINGGAVAENGAAIGSSGAGAAAPNTITIEAGGNVILNAGTAPNTGVRIGSGSNGTAGGNISIEAGGSIELNGTERSAAIRTLDNVTLEAASISEAGSGFILANTLTTGTIGDTSLTGPNAVSNYNGTSGGNLTLNNGVALDVTSINAGGHAAVTNFGNVTISGAWDSSSASITANGFGSTIGEAGAGFIQAGSLTTFSEGATSLTGANQVQSFNGSTGFGGDISLNNTGALNLIGMNAGGNVTLTNTGAISVTGLSSSFGSIEITTIGGALTLTNSLSSAGAMTLDIDGTLKVSANGPQTAQLITNNGGQTITAQSVDVVAQNGGFATIVNSGSGEQRITINGGGTGAGLDVHTLAGGGFAQIAQQSAGFAQTIEVTDADHIGVNGAGASAGPFPGGAAIFAFGGTQTLSITGSGANAIRVGSLGARGFSNIGGGFNQSITAGLAGEQGSITIVGSDAQQALAGFVTNPVAGGTQTVSTSGAISITGGRAPTGAFSAGIFHNGSGAQTITAGDISLTGGPGGNGNRAQIGSFGGGVPANAGHQIINVAGGEISVRGSDAGSSNTASIQSSGDQTINGNPDLVLVGGASTVPGVATNNFAVIQTVAGRSQTIHAGTITITNSPTANADSFAAISSSHQAISTTGDVVLTANGGSARIGAPGPGGGATDLQLTVGGSLLIDGGISANGAAIGSSGIGTAFANDIRIAATGDVILNSGTGGARIGSAAATGTAGGAISVSARSIQLNGTGGPAAIRTLGNVELHADQPGGVISESGNAFILANSLSTSSHGNTSLTGPNQVAAFNAASGADVSLNNAGVLNVTGMAAVGDATITNIGDVTVSGPWTAGGTSSITVGSDILLNAAMVSPEVVLVANDGAIIEAPTGSIAADTLTTVSSGETRLAGTNDVDTFNSTSSGGLTFNNTSGTLTLGHIDTNGGAFSLTQTGDLNVTREFVFDAPVNIAVGGTLAVLGGADPGAVAQITGHAPINISVGEDLRIAGGSGDGAFARILGYSDINLTVGGFLTLNAGSGEGAWARIQTVSRDLVIRLHFPNLMSGGFFVNGIEGLLRDGHTGFLSENGVAAPDHQLITTYGAP
jgi:filamentous hemagglutinin family protein